MDCTYDGPGGRLVGPTAIIGSYRSSGEWGRASLDHVSYRSTLTPDGEGGALVTFEDHIRHAGEAHTYRCQQRLRAGADGICAITHRELPRERKRLVAFFQRHGLTR